MSDRRFSICMPYHDNPAMWEKQLLNAYGLPRYLKNEIEIVLCDDCSIELPKPPTSWLVSPIQMFRLNGAHVPWSHRVASNVAVHESGSPFVIVTDIDHIVPEDTLQRLSVDPFFEFSRDKVYTFERRNADGSRYKPHPDSWLMRREMWERIGGYDERYRGVYGQNMPFIERVRHHAAEIKSCGLDLVRYSREDIHDASERVLMRKSPAARAAMAQLVFQFKKDGTFFDRHALTNSYHRVL